MDYGKRLESMMQMSDATWKRHANPWSVWTRVPVLPLLALAIWSRMWIGWWSLLPVTALIIWTIYNPRAFPKPVSTKSWASRATLGERVWLNRKTVPIPDHHVRFSHILNTATALAMIPFIYGLVSFEPMVTVLGLALVLMGKFWFLDRMVWLYEDMKSQDDEYASWLY
jgi:Family of unknown function (DUF6653)